ncbi:tyrosine-protein phosphatase [Streptomyces litchfieldiae]|uniref:Tyrosine-protein phosphatase n=1 Tax=Streptomyces litchfieldiae TaxID=3075543 RepID=A0ABU2MWL8_9ACTN|nr:tyrosine-protein phosphatase [Streptomyces sp. DSM 44938]MDT0346042.1 tyrosine-protein phosphatase [Streptomyces sp. DSM 44938]
MESSVANGHLAFERPYSFRDLGGYPDPDGGPAVFHRASGKDRTGLLAALRHRLLEPAAEPRPSFPGDPVRSRAG